MSTKLRYYCDLSERTAQDITHKRGNWLNFLDSAAKLYKYSFSDQLLIHAQRPGVTACAPIEIWNEKFDRWVIPGKKGIALIDDGGTRPRLKYVFDVDDTQVFKEHTPPVNVWELKEEHKPLVLTGLAKIYGHVNFDSISETFNNIASQMAAEYYEDNRMELRYRTEGSCFEDYDDDNLRTVFVSAVAVSMAYLMMSRCGFNTEVYFSEDDFNHISNFNTPDIIHALGEATSDLSAQVLRDVELVVKKYERQKSNEIQQEQQIQLQEVSRQQEIQHPQVQQTLNQNPNTERNVDNEYRNNAIQSAFTEQPTGNSRDDGSGIRPGGGLSSAQHTTDRGQGREAAGQIRPDAEVFPEEPPQNNLRPDAVQGNSVPPLQRNGGAGGSTADTGIERDIGESGPARQRVRPDGLGGGDEHYQSPSGGIGAARTDLRGNLTESPQSDESQSRAAGPGSERSEQPGSPHVGTTLNTETENVLAGDLQQVERAAMVDTTEPPPITENLLHALSTSSLTTNDTDRSTKNVTLLVPASQVDYILRDGGNEQNSVLRITAHFAKNLPLQANADYLRDEYLLGRYKYHRTRDSGKGFQFGNDKISIWFDGSGIKIGRGDSAIYARDSVLVTWEQAAERVRQLYDSGHYVNHDVLDEALHNEHVELAEDLLNLYRDDFRDFRDVPENWGWRTGGWPDTIEHLAQLLKDKGDNDGKNSKGSEYTTILERLREDVAAFEAERETNTSLRQWHDLGRQPEQLAKQATGAQGTLQALEKLNFPPHGFPAAKIHNLNAMQDAWANSSAQAEQPARFITNDEIDSHLTKGSNFSEGKMRIFSYFLHNHTPKERVDFLKNEYGHSGGTWVESGDGRYSAEPGKGITLQRKNCADVNLSWNAVSKRIGELIQSGRYMIGAGADLLHSYEMLILARQVKRFFETLPTEERHQSPFADGLDFHYPRQDETEALQSFMEDNAEIEACLDKMRYTLDNTPVDDRYYDVRKTAFVNLTAYCNGEYTLFPNYEKYQRPASEPLSMPSGLETRALPQQSAQLSIFETSPFPTLPGAVEQQPVIERKGLWDDSRTNVAVDSIEAEVDANVIGADAAV